MSYRFHIIRLAGSRLTDEECTLAMPIHDVSETRGGMLKLGMLAVDYEGGDSPHMPVVVAYWTRCWEEPDFNCLLYTSDAADDLLCVDLGGRRIIKKKNNNKN